jgi:NADH:ubiquinone oxidoreductase subunit E
VAGTENIFEQLRSIQSEYGYLPADKLQALSKEAEIPLFHIHGVADFYPHFHLSPPPKVSARVCSDMSCHLRGANSLRDSLKRRFGVMSARDVVVGEVSCLGQCDGAPAISINDHIYRNANSAQAEALVLTALGGGMLPEMEAESLTNAERSMLSRLTGGRWGSVSDGALISLQLGHASALGFIERTMQSACYCSNGLGCSFHSVS